MKTIKMTVMAVVVGSMFATFASAAMAEETKNIPPEKVESQTQDNKSAPSSPYSPTYEQSQDPSPSK